MTLKFSTLIRSFSFITVAAGALGPLMVVSGCGTDNSHSPVEVSVEALCEDPDAYDGRVIVVGAPVSHWSVGTAAGCDPQCCNAIEGFMGFDCDESPFGPVLETAVALLPDDDGAWPEAQGEVVEPDETWAELMTLIEQTHTRFGCVGQECYPVCTPAQPEELATVTGIFRMGEMSLTGGLSGATFQRSIRVTSVELVDGTRLP